MHDTLKICRKIRFPSPQNFLFHGPDPKPTGINWKIPLALKVLVHVLKAGPVG